MIFVVRVYYEKLGHMLKPLVPKFRLDLSVRLKDIAENMVPAKLKPIESVVKISGKIELIALDEYS